MANVLCLMEKKQFTKAPERGAVVPLNVGTRDEVNICEQRVETNFGEWALISQF